MTREINFNEANYGADGEIVLEEIFRFTLIL